MDSKYDSELAAQLLEWIQEITGEELSSLDGNQDNLYEQLKNGQLLCRLINGLQPDTIAEKRINQSKFAFKCMENISLFTEACIRFGVPKEETFQSVDLWERQNLTSVLVCLQSLARKASKFGKKALGPKEAEPNKREFSDEQLAQSATVISLQYGSNKGATQSGINFGNTRHM